MKIASLMIAALNVGLIHLFGMIALNVNNSTIY